ncbi:RNA polymerase sigma factor [Actinacidiphila oryziradicis]|uniref:RNA polymerase sigma factor n=1 Tax=Actinacidiphila oryziradicis TaxID=2571141 RepID=A0A4U0RYE7_9ACTN|nr:RNA polymerase sigma factor [Actinacidiphila oryziradicis]
MRDPAGFATFYEQQFDAVLGFVTRRVDDPHLAADLTADIFVAALEGAHTYDARRGAPIAWLYGISRNVIHAHFQGSAREQQAVARICGRRLLDDQDVNAIEARIDADRAARQMATAHAALSDPLRQVLDLVALDGLTIREAAHALGISSTTARVRLHRARKPCAPPASHLRKPSGGRPVNAPLHFKQQLADELNAHATSLSAPAGHRALLRLRAPRRRMTLTIGAVATAAAVAVALPLASGSHSTQQAAQAPHGTVNTGPGTSATPTPTSGSLSTGLNIVNADYAVQSKPGGMVAIQLFNPKGVPGLQAALDKAGIPAAVLTPTASCHATIHNDGSARGDLKKVMPPSDTRREPDGIYHLINPSAIPAGDYLLFVARFEPGQVQGLGFTLVRQVPACVPSE